ncbi:MAG: hypothetical protein HZA50_19670 [Planctomycetes bacterium]|nr:hypothetical protein [Planctomycetota bacterium]
MKYSFVVEKEKTIYVFQQQNNVSAIHIGGDIQKFRHLCCGASGALETFSMGLSPGFAAAGSAVRRSTRSYFLPALRAFACYAAESTRRFAFATLM